MSYEDWEKKIRQDYPELDICTSGSGSLYLLNLPFKARKVCTIFDMLDIVPEQPPYYTVDRDRPFLVYTNGLYYLARLLWDEPEWQPIIKKGCVYLLPEKTVKEDNEQKPGSVPPDGTGDKKKKQGKL